MATTNEKQLDELYDLIEDIRVAMLTTRRPDGQLVSRPMATQDHTGDADVWFATDIESHKLDELEHDPHVNVAWYDSGSHEWVSLSGTARISRDRDRIRELWKPDWQAWFPKLDETRDGSADDPRIALILVDAERVTYQKHDRPTPVVLFEIAKGMLTGEEPDIRGPKHLHLR